MSAEPIQESAATESAGKYSPASPEEIEGVLGKCLEALAMIPYVEVSAGEVQDSNKEMVLIKCHARTDRFTPEMMRLDFTTVWKAIVVAENTSMHSFLDTAVGFEFRFAILYEGGTYITGRFMIEPPPTAASNRLLRGSAK